MKNVCIFNDCKSPRYGGKNYCRRHVRQKSEGKLISEQRRCKGCNENLPIEYRPDHLFCSKPCKMKYHRKFGCYTKEKILILRGSCTISGCNLPIHAHKLCQRHANNLHRHGNPLISKKKQRGKCCLPKCDREHLAKGFCRVHYHSNREYGDPLYVESKRARDKEATRKIEYKRWLGMKTRCNNPRAGNYSLYGAKGIKVDALWQNDFWTFYNEVGPIPSPSQNFHLSRKDHNKGYIPGNVEWTQASTNSRYHGGVNFTFEVANEIRKLYPGLTMQKLANLYNVSIGHILQIINNKVWIDKQYNPPKHRRRSKLTMEDKIKIKRLREEGHTLGKIAEKFDISSIATIHTIVRDGFRGKKSSHPLYSIWTGMMRRCYDVNFASYKNYGAKGVKVCDQWHSFENFINDISPRPSERYTLDRIVPEGNYGPNNIKWSTASEQNKNKRVHRRAKFFTSGE